jgi:hypothetical protein
VQMPTRRVFPFFPLLAQRSSLFFGHNIHPHYSKTLFNALSSTKLASEIN